MSQQLTLLSIDHGVALSILLASEELLTALSLLFLLNQIADGAAAGKGDISQARTLEVVLVTDVAALHGLRNPVETNAHGGEEEKALFGLLGDASQGEHREVTYGSVDWLISFHVSVLAGSVMSLTEGDTCAAVGHAA
jgi:hypothetical protein